MHREILDDDLSGGNKKNINTIIWNYVRKLSQRAFLWNTVLLYFLCYVLYLIHSIFDGFSLFLIFIFLYLVVFYLFKFIFRLTLWFSFDSFAKRNDLETKRENLRGVFSFSIISGVLLLCQVGAWICVLWLIPLLFCVWSSDPDLMDWIHNVLEYFWSPLAGVIYFITLFWVISSEKYYWCATLQSSFAR